MRIDRRSTGSAGVLVLLTAAAASIAVEPDRRVIGPMIKAGDPAAVPILRAWLNEAASKPLDERSDAGNLTDLSNAVSDCSMYELDEAGPQIVRLYRAIPAGKTGWIPGIVRAAARYRSSAARSFQWTLLGDPRVADDFLRTQLLSALAEGGDDRAVEMLGTFVESQLANAARGSSVSGELEADIPRTPSAALYARIGRIAATDNADADHALSRLKEQFDFYAQSPGALMDRIEHASPSGVSVVNDALAMLSRVGMLQDVPRLATLPLGERNAIRDKTRLRGVRDEAIASIRRRHWSEFVEATTRPTTAKVAE